MILQWTFQLQATTSMDGQNPVQSQRRQLRKLQAESESAQVLRLQSVG